MGILSHIEKLFTPTNYSQPVLSREDTINRTYNILKNNAVTCRCNSLAIPTKNRGKIYRCIKCKRQFANAYYNLNLAFVAERYDEAVELLEPIPDSV